MKVIRFTLEIALRDFFSSFFFSCGGYGGGFFYGWRRGVYIYINNSGELEHYLFGLYSLFEKLVRVHNTCSLFVN